MRRVRRTSASIIVATLVVVSIAHAAGGPTRAEYVAQVEPICEANTLASQRILAGARDKVRQKKLASAGAQFIRAAAAFGKATGEIAAVPRPPADELKLTKWVEHLRLVQSYLRKAGGALKNGNRNSTTIDVIKLRSAGNAANNVVYDFEFHYCRITASRFT
ncbi:MAG TPA: hypothetical protein VNY83_04205 [Solirubrobacterales bacterium]|jgi:hypothetical protein|nr:hypothetical protein [Solirubrobacterales bacterium]